MSPSKTLKTVDLLARITSLPSPLRKPAHSTAIYPPPMTNVFPGFSLRENKSSLVMAHFLSSGRDSYYLGRTPVAITNDFALS